MAAAHDQTCRGDDVIGALPARELRTFLDAVDRNFGGAAEHGEDRAVLEEVDVVVTPFAGGDLAAVKAENAVELAPVESDSAGGGGGQRAPGFAPRGIARLRIALAPPAPPSRGPGDDGHDPAGPQAPQRATGGAA